MKTDWQWFDLLRGHAERGRVALKKLPEREAERPGDEALTWHNERFFPAQRVSARRNPLQRPARARNELIRLGRFWGIRTGRADSSTGRRKPRGLARCASTIL